MKPQEVLNNIVAIIEYGEIISINKSVYRIRLDIGFTSKNLHSKLDQVINSIRYINSQ